MSQDISHSHSQIPNPISNVIQSESKGLRNRESDGVRIRPSQGQKIWNEMFQLNCERKGMNSPFFHKTYPALIVQLSPYFTMAKLVPTSRPWNTISFCNVLDPYPYLYHVSRSLSFFRYDLCHFFKSTPLITQSRVAPPITTVFLITLKNYLP